MPEIRPKDLDGRYAALEERVRRLERRNPRAVVVEGTFATRPAPSPDNALVFYYANDTDMLYLSTGVAWKLIT